MSHVDIDSLLSKFAAARVKRSGMVSTVGPVMGGQNANVFSANSNVPPIPGNLPAPAGSGGLFTSTNPASISLGAGLQNPEGTLGQYPVTISQNYGSAGLDPTSAGGWQMSPYLFGSGLGSGLYGGLLQGLGGYTLGNILGNKGVYNPLNYAAARQRAPDGSSMYPTAFNRTTMARMDPVAGRDYVAERLGLVDRSGRPAPDAPASMTLRTGSPQVPSGENLGQSPLTAEEARQFLADPNRVGPAKVTVYGPKGKGEGEKSEGKGKEPTPAAERVVSMPGAHENLPMYTWRGGFRPGMPRWMGGRGWSAPRSGWGGLFGLGLGLGSAYAPNLWNTFHPDPTVAGSGFAPQAPPVTGALRFPIGIDPNTGQRTAQPGTFIPSIPGGNQ